MTCTVTTFQEQLFVAYLRGIETAVTTYGEYMLGAFVAYLRGIETGQGNSLGVPPFLSL